MAIILVFYWNFPFIASSALSLLYHIGSKCVTSLANNCNAMVLTLRCAISCTVYINKFNLHIELDLEAILYFFSYFPESTAK